MRCTYVAFVIQKWATRCPVETFGTGHSFRVRVRFYYPISLFISNTQQRFFSMFPTLCHVLLKAFASVYVYEWVVMSEEKRANNNFSSFSLCSSRIQICNVCSDILCFDHNFLAYIVIFILWLRSERESALFYSEYRCSVQFWVLCVTITFTESVLNDL